MIGTFVACGVGCGFSDGCGSVDDMNCFRGFMMFLILISR
jgi:hypothetical protein